MVETFFALLKDALWHDGVHVFNELTEAEASEISKMAEKQAVAGLVLDAITRNDIKIPKEALYEMLGLQERIKYQSWKTNLGAVALHKVLNGNDNLNHDPNDNVEYVVVKGQVVASYYPAPLLRQSGDIDFYCKGDNFEKALQMVQDRWKVKAEIHGSEKHADFKYNGNIYEGHYILTDLLSKERNDYFQHVIDNDKGMTVEIDGGQLRTLSPTVHVLFVFLHLWYHLMALGVGLRQFCDMAVMLHYAKEQIDMNALYVHLKALEMERVWKACCCILVDKLGVAQDETGYMITDRDRRYGQRIFDIVLFRGNMGHHNKIGGFHGWKHKVEAMGIKLAHFVKFYSLSPSCSRRWLWHEVARRNKA